VFGTRHRPRTIALTCPHCGSEQEEPRRVVSSFCRSCGEHFRVVKGIAVASPGLRTSGIAEVRPPQERRRLAPHAARPVDPRETASWLASADDSATPREMPRPSEEPAPLSAGAFFGFADTVADDGNEAPTSEKLIGADSQARETLAEGSIAALIGEQQTFVAAEREKMPPDYAPPESRRRVEGVRGFPVRCFRCDHVQQVSRYAKSTQCERCSAYIGFADYEVKKVHSATLRTRGDIVVSRRGALLPPSEIACRHFTANGPFDARIDCTGDAVFSRSGTVHGPLRCERLVIERGCEVSFPDGALAGRAEVSGRLVGNLACTGKVRIGREGVVEGDLRAADVDLREGGRVSGELHLAAAAAKAEAPATTP
jgi:cytoskeletal protein CcmA (bactofilin family)